MTARRVVSNPLGFQADWYAPKNAAAPKARVIDPYLWDSAGIPCVAPRYIALRVGGGLRINIEDTEIAMQIIEVLTEAIAEKTRLDRADNPDGIESPAIHEPIEYGTDVIHQVCRTCGVDWPCPPEVAVRDGAETPAEDLATVAELDVPRAGA